MDINALGALIVGSLLPVIAVIGVWIYLIVGAIVVLVALIGAAITRPTTEVTPDDASGLDELDRLFDDASR